MNKEVCELNTRDIDPFEFYEFYEELTSVILNCNGKEPDGLKKLWYDMEDFLIEHNTCIHCGGNIVVSATYDDTTGSYMEERYCSECHAEYE